MEDGSERDAKNLVPVLDATPGSDETLAENPCARVRGWKETPGRS